MDNLVPIRLTPLQVVISVRPRSDLLRLLGSRDLVDLLARVIWVLQAAACSHLQRLKITRFNQEGTPVLVPKQVVVLDLVMWHLRLEGGSVVGSKILVLAGSHCLNLQVSLREGSAQSWSFYFIVVWCRMGSTSCPMKNNYVLGISYIVRRNFRTIGMVMDSCLPVLASWCRALSCRLLPHRFLLKYC